MNVACVIGAIVRQGSREIGRVGFYGWRIGTIVMSISTASRRQGPQFNHAGQVVITQREQGKELGFSATEETARAQAGEVHHPNEFQLDQH
jgi:hypothetical protein